MIKPAYRCQVCGEKPKWRFDRIGDAVVSWACVDHFDEECQNLQRSWETTELTVRPCVGKHYE